MHVANANHEAFSSIEMYSTVAIVTAARGVFFLTLTLIFSFKTKRPFCTKHYSST